jgi:hypothetical protein
MKHHASTESYLEGTISIAQRGSEDVSCNDCGTIYDLLVTYKEALEADRKEKGDKGA